MDPNLRRVGAERQRRGDPNENEVVRIGLGWRLDRRLLGGRQTDRRSQEAG